MLIRNKNIMIDKYSLINDVPPNFAPNHKLDFRLSRYALTRLTNTDEYEIIDHLYLKNHPNLLVSISHTKGLGCAFICDRKEVKSIGIDIEWTSRLIKKGIEKFFLRDEDSKELNNLELWCIKEAAFKAHSPLYTGEKTLVLKDFIINKGSVFFMNKEIGSYHLEYNQIDNKELLIVKVYEY